MSAISKKLPASARGTPKWILAELRSLRAGASLTTSEIAKRIARSRGKTYHRNSVYNGLRLLVRRGTVQVVKAGRQKIYRLAGAVRGRPPAAPAPAPTPVGTPSAPQVAGGARAALHKLAHGEILVLESTARHVISATNRKGRLILKRHKIP
jgi:hypothetical protein